MTKTERKRRETETSPDHRGAQAGRAMAAPDVAHGLVAEWLKTMGYDKSARYYPAHSVWASAFISSFAAPRASFFVWIVFSRAYVRGRA